MPRSVGADAALVASGSRLWRFGASYRMLTPIHHLTTHSLETIAMKRLALIIVPLLLVSAYVFAAAPTKKTAAPKADAPP
jgi:hypothetical protein